MDDLVSGTDSNEVPGALEGISLFNEASDIYEVEKIIAGPLRRREHLNKICYKVRWKGYGPEEDTWQPKADLVYVEDLIDDYTREKNQQIKQRKRKIQEEVLPTQKENGPETKKATQPASVPSDDTEHEKSWHPDYGYMKDTFWKDLELGRITNILHEGDMYSKVKGSRRAAHAEAMANIQKQQQPPQSKSNVPTNIKKTTPPKSSLKNGIHLHIEKSPSLKSPCLSPNKVSYNAVKNKSIQKRNPFGARGYMSAKRSRRSKANMVTSTRSALSSPAVEVIKQSNSATDQSEAPLLQVQDSTDNKMDPSPQLDLSVAATDDSLTGAESLVNDIFLSPNESGTTCGSGCLSGDISKLNGIVHEQNSNSIPDSTSDHDSTHIKSTLHVRAEAKLSVERSHNEECLWGGACNRSDCKANRRWNNKNGRENEAGSKECEASVNTSTSTRSTSSSTSSASSHTSSIELPRMPSGRDSTSSNPDHHSHHPNVFSPSPVKRSSTSSAGLSPASPLNPSEHTLGFQGPLSSRSYSSDSSFDDGLAPSLSRDAVSNSFTIDTLSKKVQLESTASSDCSSDRGGAHSINVSYSSSTTKQSFGGSGGSERPGLFSDTFSFLMGEASASSSSSHTSGISSHQSSPGKENSGRTITSTPALAGSSSHKVDKDIISNIKVTPSSSPISSHNVSSGRSRVTDVPIHKRTSGVSLPLEKIPSPNSSRSSELDKRISTLTCDELEDFPEQAFGTLLQWFESGDDCFGHNKGGSFVTNADLLQAINLGKSEVVKRGVHQSSSGSGHKLDLEQPDAQGLTLLMKAVQKGNLATVELLLENGVNVNSQQVNGFTPLMMAAEQNNVCLVTLLLKHGANSSLYTITTDVAETALMKAIKRQHKEVVNLMLRVGVNISAPTHNGISALQLAMDRRNPHIEALVRAHIDRLTSAFEARVLSTLEDTAQLLEQLFPLQCFPLREANQFTVKFNTNIKPVPSGEGFLLFIAHTKINDKGVRCRFHGSCPISSVSLNGIEQSPLTKEVNFVTSCHPIISGCNELIISKLPEYTSKAKLLVCAYRARLIC